MRPTISKQQDQTGGEQHDIGSREAGVRAAGAFRHAHDVAATRPLAGACVAKRLGPRDATITLTMYADAIPDDDVELAGAFDRAVYRA